MQGFIYSGFTQMVSLCGSTLDILPYKGRTNDVNRRDTGLRESLLLLQFISEFLGHRVSVVLYDLLERTEWERKNEVTAFPSH